MVRERGDATAIAHAIERLLVEWDLRSRRAEGSREAASRRGWEEPAAEMEALYGRLVTAK